MKATLVILETLVAVSLGFPQAPDTMWTTHAWLGQDNQIGRVLDYTPEGGLVVLYERTVGSRIAKLEIGGNQLWDMPACDESSMMGRMVDVVGTADGGALLAGNYVNLMFLPKRSRTDADGNELWCRVGEFYFHVFTSVTSTENGGFVLAGTSEPGEFSGSDIVVLAIDATGNEIWRDSLGGNGGLTMMSPVVVNAPDGGVLVAGSHAVPDTLVDPQDPYDLDSCGVAVIRYDATGTRLWLREFWFGGFAILRHVVPRATGGFTVIFDLSQTMSFQIDDHGDTTSLSPFPTSKSLAETADGGLILVTEPGNLVKLHSSGRIQWELTPPGTLHETYEDVIVLPDSGYAVCGSYWEYDPNWYMNHYGLHIARFAPDPLVYASRDLSIAISEDNVILRWQWSGSPYYHVLSSVTSDGPFELEGSTADTSLVLSTEGIGDRQFFTVVGSSVP